MGTSSPRKKRARSPGTKRPRPRIKQNMKKKDPLIHATVRKYFPGHGWYTGTVKFYNAPLKLYRVAYDDGDSEDIEASLIQQLVDKYQTSTTTNDNSNDSAALHSQIPIGGTIEKHFPGHGTFRGTIQGFDTTNMVYDILYEDGDAEGMGAEDVFKHLVKKKKNNEDDEENGDDGQNMNADTKSVASSGTTDNQQATFVSARQSVADSTTIGDRETLLPTTTTAKKFVGARVEKYFAGYGTYQGNVTAYNPIQALYGVVYDDGDSEELREVDLQQILLQSSNEENSQSEKDHASPNNSPPPDTETAQKHTLASSNKGKNKVESGSTKKRPRTVPKRQGGSKGNNESAKSKKTVLGTSCTPVKNGQMSSVSPTQATTPSLPEPSDDPDGIVLHAPVSKFFDGYGWFRGIITEVDTAQNMYRVLYDDGDEEVLRRADVLEILVRGDSAKKKPLPSASPEASPEESSTAEGSYF